MRTDADIQRAVINELKWDTRIDPSNIHVRVDGAIVSLAGSVKSWAERSLAATAAHRVSGVRDVANDVDVKLPPLSNRTDSDIAHVVRHALEWNVFVPEARIRSTVSNGWVTLEGDVDLWTEREDADKAVRELSGVLGVVNKIEVKPAAEATEVRHSIEEALRRKADREAMHISIEVSDGHVQVKGVVPSFTDKEAVLGAVKGTRGVREIEDKIQIEWAAH